MARNLASLTINALDEFAHLEKLQDALEICLEELSNPSEAAQLRVELLIGLYLPMARLRLEELKITLERIQEHVMGKE